MRLAISPRNIPLTEGDRKAKSASRLRALGADRPQVVYNLLPR